MSWWFVCSARPAHRVSNRIQLNRILVLARVFQAECPRQFGQSPPRQESRFKPERQDFMVEVLRAQDQQVDCRLHSYRLPEPTLRSRSVREREREREKANRIESNRIQFNSTRILFSCFCCSDVFNGPRTDTPPPRPPPPPPGPSGDYWGWGKWGFILAMALLGIPIFFNRNQNTVSTAQA